MVSKPLEDAGQLGRMVHFRDNNSKVSASKHNPNVGVEHLEAGSVYPHKDARSALPIREQTEDKLPGVLPLSQTTSS